MIPTDLYRLLMISSGGLTHRLDRLEKAGLIERRRSEQDKRSFEVALTAEGVARAEAAFREDMARELRHLDVLDEGERRALAGLLRKLAGSIEAAGADAAEPNSV
jgi:DNA-binding MarR family transcriptional regulator